MTALSRYDRLEAPGLYTPAAGAQRRDVVLSLGQATLTIADARDVALAHWSLAALQRLNPGETPALYAPAAEAAERVETDDAEMIQAIETIRRAVERSRPHAGRLRGRLVLGAALAVAALAVFWLPGAVERYAAAILPPVTRAALGRAVAESARPLTGAPCRGAQGAVALEALLARLGDLGPARVAVVPAGVRGALHLPGGLVLLNRAVVETRESPAAVAGFLLAEAERATTADPVIPLLRHAGLGATLALMTSGRLPGRALDGYAEALMLRPPPPYDPGGLLARFAAAGVPATPYARAVDPTGEATRALIEGDPVPPGAAVPVLSDADWVALQGICAS